MFWVELTTSVPTDAGVVTMLVVEAGDEAEVVFVTMAGLSPNLKEKPLLVVVLVGAVVAGVLDPNVKVLAGLNAKLLSWVEV